MFLRSREKPLKTTAPVQKSRCSSKSLKTGGNFTVLTEKSDSSARNRLFLNSRVAGRRTTEKHAKSIARAPLGHLPGTSRAPPGHHVFLSSPTPAHRNWKKNNSTNHFFFNLCAQAWWKHTFPSNLQASVASLKVLCIYIYIYIYIHIYI